MKRQTYCQVIHGSVCRATCLFSLAPDVWLTTDQMAELFQKSRSTVNERILNIYEEQELDSQLSVRKIRNSAFSTEPSGYYNKAKNRLSGFRGLKRLKDTRLPNP